MPFYKHSDKNIFNISHIICLLRLELPAETNRYFPECFATQGTVRY